MPHFASFYRVKHIKLHDDLAQTILPFIIHDITASN